MLAENQYAAYVFHLPVVVFVQYLVAERAMWPFAKFALVTAVSVPLTFLLSAVLRDPVLVRRIL